MDERNEVNAENTASQADCDIFPEYKRTAFRVSVFTAVIFSMRIPAVFIEEALYTALSGVISPDALYMLRLTVSMLFLQILPAVTGAAMFGFFGNKGEKLKAMYRVPKNTVKAVGNFPVIYGVGMLVNIITIGVTMLFTPAADYEKTLNPVITNLKTPGLGSAWFMFAFMFLLAPVFEELVFRGILLNTLKPYGSRMAVFYTGILFGLYHGNFSQCFYAAAGGIALGYIANVTGSLIPSTIIHMMMNSVSGCALLLMSVPGIQKYLFSGEADGEIPDGDMVLIVLFIILMISAFVLAVLGAVLFFVKLKNRRRYRLPRVHTEISGGRKASALLLTVPSAIALLLMIDTFTGFSAELIDGLFT